MSGRPAPGLPYSASCPRCGSAAGQACVAQRAPFDVCAWPHRERVAAVERFGRQRALLLI